MRAALAAALAVVVIPACEGLTSADDVPIAVQFVSPPDTIAVGDTVALHTRVLNRSGDSIPGAQVVLYSLSPDTIGVDSARFAVIGLQPGRGRVAARSGNLPSDPLPMVVKQR